MIIYGYRNKEVEQGTGMFHCPRCGGDRAYKRKKIIRYFTLFFVRLFPLGTVSEFLECQMCMTTYPHGVLSAGGDFEPGSPAVMKSPSAIQPNPNKQPGSCLPMALLSGGAISLFAGCGVSILMVLVQIDSPNNWQGFFGLMVLCPIPLIVAGLIMFLSGLGIRRNTDTP